MLLRVGGRCAAAKRWVGCAAGVGGKGRAASTHLPARHKHTSSPSSPHAHTAWTFTSSADECYHPLHRQAAAGRLTSSAMRSAVFVTTLTTPRRRLGAVCPYAGSGRALAAWELRALLQRAPRSLPRSVRDTAPSLPPAHHTLPTTNHLQNTSPPGTSPRPPAPCSAFRLRLRSRSAATRRPAAVQWVPSVSLGENPF